MVRFANPFLAVAFLCCLAASARADGLPQYVIRARIDPKARLITAHQSVTFTNTAGQPTSVVYFHVYPNRFFTAGEKAFISRYASYFNVDVFPEGFPTTPVGVDRLRLGGQDLSFTIEGEDKTLLKVDLGRSLARGESITLELDFTVPIPAAYGRFGSIEGITALARWYPILSVYDQKGWENHPFYPFQRPFHSESGHYDVELTVPQDQTVIHSGNLQKEEASADGWKVLHITTQETLREFSLAMSNTYRLVSEEREGIEFKSYYLPGPGREDRARLAIDNAAGLMAYYGKRFGPYPYKTFSIAPVHLGYGGEQMSNVIFIDTRVFDLPQMLHRYFDFLIAHETGHQWFYNLLGVNDFTQMWMEEGWNSYFLLEYLEHKYGVGAGVIDFERFPWVEVFLPRFTFRRGADVRYKMISRIGLESPIISKLSSFNEPSNIFALTYGKGSRVVEMLKFTVGEEAFNRIFSRIFSEYRFKNLDIEDFIRICQEESGKDLAGFFEQWLYTTKHFDVTVYKGGNNEVVLRRKGKIIMPVDVQVTYQDGQQESFVWDGKQAEHRLPVNGPVKRVVADPQKKLLDIDRTNNTWPRRVRIKPVPLYLPLYDIPALMPDEDYNFIVGPEISHGVGVKAAFQKPYDYSLIAASDYDFGDEIQRTRFGVEVNNLLHSQMTFGVEQMFTADYDNGEDDLTSTKVYLRRELWPVAYNFADVNDHVTLYAVRNRTPEGRGWMGRENIRNTSYLKRDESIIGTALHFDRSRPRPDPQSGYTVDTLIENSGHWAGATQTFTRASLDYQLFHPVTLHSQMGYRMKYGWGSSNDKNLYELGGAYGLRGYGRKTVRGSDMVLGSAEYRFPLCDRLHISMLDHWFNLDKLTGVVFFDAGQAWYDDFGDAKFRKDAGLGLRFHFSVASMQNIMVRLDLAQAVGDSDQDPHFWAGLNHTF